MWGFCRNSFFFCCGPAHSHKFLIVYGHNVKSGKSVAEPQKKRKFKCYICGQEFDSLIELTKHDLKFKHKKEGHAD
jgi:hypothetical protein